MTKPSYSMKVFLSPETFKPGSTVDAKVELTGLEGELSGVYVSVPYMGVFPLQLQNDGTYESSYTIPYDAPPGTYTIIFYGRSKDGDRGPDVPVAVHLN